MQTSRSLCPLQTGKRHSEFRGADQNYANAMLRGFDRERRLTEVQGPLPPGIGSSAAASARLAPIASPAGKGRLGRPGAPPFLPCVVYCRKRTRRDICRSMRSGNRAGTRHSMLGQNHAREFRIPETGERCARHGQVALRLHSHCSRFACTPTARPNTLKIQTTLPNFTV